MVECFITESAAEKNARDPSETFERVRLALEIGQKLPHPVDPLILIMTALFDDLGRRLTGDASISGFMAAAFADSFLKVTSVSDVDRLQIARALAKFGARGVVPLDSVEQMVLSDADKVGRLGMVGVITEVSRASGSRSVALKRYLEKSENQFEGLNFQESKQVAETLFHQTRVLVESLAKSYELRPESLDQIDFPIHRPS